MKVRVSDLRHCNVLPSRKLSVLSRYKVTAIRFLPEFYEKVRKWWEAERFIEIYFGNYAPPETDDNAKITSTCGACGMCCKDIPTHQIGIYMSVDEMKVTQTLFPEKKFIQGFIDVEGAKFGVVDVKQNGDCVMLGPQGCTLGDDRPLWCKIYHCEKYQGQPYQFEEKK